MLRMAAASLAAVAAMLPTSCATTGVAPAPPATFSGAERPAAGEEVRAVWVVRHSLSSPAAARAVVEEAYGSGFNTLIVQVRGRGDALYRSTLEPRPEFLTGQPRFDALQVVVEEARARGMAVHAWVAGRIRVSVRRSTRWASLVPFRRRRIVIEGAGEGGEVQPQHPDEGGMGGASIDGDGGAAGANHEHRS